MESKTCTTENRNVTALKAHLALNVSDVSRSIEFYRSLLGIEPCKVRTGYAKFDVQNPPLNLTLNQGNLSGRGALSHLGIQVSSTEDVLALREKWTAAGLLARDEMQTDCCYALQDKTWVRDPDGNEWEAFVVLEDNLPEASACCNTEQTTEAQQVPVASVCCGADQTTAVQISARN
jgi:catechol 2,3-dioxygenase-like lactoylglutathione lyase family enzyme